MAFVWSVADSVVFVHKGQAWEAPAAPFGAPGTIEFARLIGTGLWPAFR